MVSSNRPTKHATLLLRGVVVLLIILVAIASLYFVVSQQRALRPLSELHGTAPTKRGLVHKITYDLATMDQASRSEIHTYFSTIGGTIFINEASGHMGLQQESVYWALVEMPGYKIWAVWTLTYNSQNELLEVLIGESFP
jgi:hypothetical protein